MRSIVPRPGNRLAAALPLIAIQAGLLLFVLYLSTRETKDADLFFHLRTGSDILHSHHVPGIDTYSRAGTEHGARNVAYSWLFEVVVAGFYAKLGWFGPKLYVALIGGLIALFLMADVYSIRRASWGTIFLGVGLVGLSPILIPRPWLFSVLFFLIQMKILLAYQASRRSSLLFPLIPLYVIWANVHIQFVLGLVFFMPFMIDEFRSRQFRQIAILAGVAIICAASTFINPYGGRVWETVLQYLSQSRILAQIQDTSPPHLRNLPEIVTLGLCAITAMILVRTSGHRLLFGLCLLIGIYLFLHSRRNIWIPIVISTLVFARSPNPNEKKPLALPRFPWVIVLGSFLFFGLAGFGSSIDNAREQKRLEQHNPFAATRFVRSHLEPEGTLRGPLYNSFDWGGFLIFALPELPVSIDGRTNVHGDARTLRHWATWGGANDWRTDPDLATANLVLLEHRSPLAALLNEDPSFARVYDDSLAVVFSRR